MKLPAEDWNTVSRLLDAALELPPEKREQWIGSLEGPDAEFATVLRKLLANQALLETNDFLGDALRIPDIDELRQSLTTPIASAVGASVGPYRLVEEVGRGGMGSVWRAQRADGRFEGVVAIKFVQAGWLGAAGVERFRVEGSVLARFDHPNIARLIDAGVLGATLPYLVLEFVEGEPIDAYCNRKALSAEARIALFLDVLAAVAHAHSHLIVHRDIKPANIFVTGDGAVKLLDFGIAKLLNDAGGAGVTRTNMTALTPQYAAPEQLLGQPITTAVDVYALGLVLYVLLTGTHPVTIDRVSSADLQRQILTVDPPRASLAATLAPIRPRSLVGDLDNILGRALKKSPLERYPSVSAFADDLSRLLKHEPVQARPDTVTYRVSKFVRRHRAGVAAAALIVMSVLAGTVGTAYQAHRAEANALQATRAKLRAQQQLTYAEAIDEFLSVLLNERTSASSKPLLERGQELIQGQFGDTPALRARLMLTLADVYSEDEQSGPAIQLYLDARAAADQASDPALTAHVDCSLAQEYGDAGESSKSPPLFDAAIKRLQADPERDPAVLAGCLEGRAAVRILMGETAAALADAREALERLGEPRPGLLTLALNIHMTLADAHARLGEAPLAVQEYERAVRELGRAGRANTEFAVSILNDFGVLLAKSGQWSRAAEVDRQGLDIVSHLGIGEIVPSIEGNYAKLLVDLGRPREAQALFSSAIETSERLKHARSIMVNTLLSAPAWCALGDLRECESRLRRAGELMRAQLPPEHSMFGTLELEQAQLAEAKNEPAAARDHLEAALKIYRTPTGRNNNELRALAMRPVVDLKLGDAAGASEHAAEAVKRAREQTQGFGTSVWLGNALLAQGLVMSAAGDGRAGQSALLQAVEQLHASLGDDAPATQEARAALSAAAVPKPRPSAHQTEGVH
jgi:eukaryotic-like serine/threonine-protein kinase